MECSERLKYFIDNNFCSIKNFCDTTQIDQSLISRYCKGVHFPSGEALRGFYLAGLSLDWLISGNGSMYAGNNEGRALRSKYYEKYPPNLNAELKLKIKNWIIEHYNTIDEFVKQNNISSSFVVEELENIASPKPEFIMCLQNAGCDIECFLNEQEDQYSSTPEGFLLHIVNENIKNTNNDKSNVNLDKLVERIENSFKKIINDILIKEQ